jgi:hypothetical protein
MTSSVLGIAATGIVVSVECLLYTRTVQCGVDTFFFVYKSVWTDNSPNHPALIQIREFVRDTGAVLLAEVEQYDRMMLFRKARMLSYLIPGVA